MFLSQVSVLADFKKCSLLAWTLLSCQFCTFFQKKCLDLNGKASYITTEGRNSEL